MDAHIDGVDVLSANSDGGALAADLFKLILGRGVSAGGSFKLIHDDCSADTLLKDNPAIFAIIGCGGPPELTEPEPAPFPRGH